MVLRKLLSRDVKLFKIILETVGPVLNLSQFLLQKFLTVHSGLQISLELVSLHLGGIRIVERLLESLSVGITFLADAVALVA